MGSEKDTYQAPCLWVVPLGPERVLCASLDPFNDSGEYEWNYQQ